MRRRLKTIMLLVMTAVCMTSGSAYAVKIRSPAPGFTLKDINGKNFCLESLRGNVVILNFWSINCAPCVAELPSLNALYHELKGSRLTVLGISIDPSVKPVKVLAEKQQIEYPILMDSAQEVYFDTYSLFGQPVSVIIDQSGVIQDKIVGQVDWTSPRMRTRIQALLKGR